MSLEASVIKYFNFNPMAYGESSDELKKTMTLKYLNDTSGRDYYYYYYYKLRV